MELAPTPRRRRWSGSALVLLGVVVLAPVTAFAVVPTAVGLERYVVSSDELAGSIGRGSVVFEQRIPIGDVVEGDVVTYLSGVPSVDGDGGALVTRRVFSVGDGVLLTGSDDPAAALAGQSVLDAVSFADHATIPVVAVAVPWIGYPFLGVLGHRGWGVAVTLLGLLLGAACLRVGRASLGEGPRTTAGLGRPRTAPAGSTRSTSAK